MATAVNTGRDFFVWNFSVGTNGSTLVLNQKVNSLVIQCRTGVDINIRRSAGASDYFTLKSGSTLTLDIGTNNLAPLHITSTSGTVVIEVIGHIE